jgi:hypothetical protein
MEGDSVHSIENATKRMNIYSSNDWVGAIKTAEQTQPKYDVIEIKHPMILNFKECVSSVVSNRRKDENGETVFWNDSF